MKKYELTNETIVHDDLTLYRIRALKDFADVKKGDLGGFVESENNLSHLNKAWVYDKARVCGNARMFDNARVSGNSVVFGNSWVNK